jgi:hypothetical protein
MKLSTKNFLRFFRRAAARGVCATALALASLVALGGQTAQADAVVTNCTNVGLQAALNTGGLIQFNCGAGSTTITISTTLVVSRSVASTTIDGENKITLQGNGSVRLIFHETWGYVATTLTLKNLTLTRGRAIGAGEAANGGAVWSVNHSIDGTTYPPTLNVDHVTFTDNDAQVSGGSTYDYGGGAIYSLGGRVNVTNSTFSGNDAVNGGGGAIHILQSSLTIANSTFSTNSAIGTYSQGGAIYVDGLSPTPVFTISGSRFEGNTTYNSGGAIYVNMYEDASQFTVDTTSFVNNAVVGGSGALGGAISGGGTDNGGGTGNPSITITRSLFAGNRAQKSVSPYDGSGGALAFAQRARVTITNSTLSGNRAEGTSDNANGGAFYAGSNTAFTLNNDTFANNYAGWVGGAICASNGSVKNTVFSNNSAYNGGNDWNIQQTCAAELADDGHNLQYPPRTTNPYTWNEVTCFSGKSDIDQRSLPDFQNPQLAALADNGGPTQTMAIGPTSPAFSRGNNATCAATDQRGIARPQALTCDAGAYEWEAKLRLSPAMVGKGEPGFTLTVYGAGFTTTSQALWNGASLPTTFVDSLQLRAAVDAGLIASSGTVTVSVSGSSLQPASLLIAEQLWRVYAPVVRR